MKPLAWIVGIAAALWSAVWVVGASTTERVMTGWLQDRAAEGWLVNYTSLDTSGFPLRFRTDLTDLQLADPETGWAWTAPEFRLNQPGIRPQRIRAVWPAEQTLASPFERLTILSDEISAELELRPASNLALGRSDMTLRAVEVTSTDGWQTLIESAVFTVTAADGGAEAHVYDILFNAERMVPPDPMRRVLDPAGVLPEAMEGALFQARMQFDAPWDLAALQDARPGITDIDLTEMSAGWGELTFRAAGRLSVDATGIPTGDIAVRAENWREMVGMAVNAGVLPEQVRGTLETTLALIANLSGRPEDIEAPLSFRNGRMFFGPFPLGPAPRLALR